MTTANPAFQVFLFSERGLDRKHATEVAAWFTRCAGPVSLEVVTRPVDVTLSESGEIPWESAFKKLRELRSVTGVESEDFIYLLTRSPNENNWYAAEDPENSRNGFGHVGNFSWVTSAPSHAI